MEGRSDSPRAGKSFGVMPKTTRRAVGTVGRRGREAGLEKTGAAPPDQFIGPRQSNTKAHV